MLIDSIADMLISATSKSKYNQRYSQTMGRSIYAVGTIAESLPHKGMFCLKNGSKFHVSLITEALLPFGHAECIRHKI